tara:strand:- start:153 stop:560 length:408 start_codon:yes stop_codon:yes gene_type:complete
MEREWQVYLGMILGLAYLFVWLPFYYGRVGQAARLVFDKLCGVMPEEDDTPSPPRRNRTISVDEALDKLDGGIEELKEKIKSGKVRAYDDNGTVRINASDVKKPSKRSRKATRDYPVIETYDERYKISNPVEFTT